MIYMKKSLDNIFSEDNLLDYGRACLDVAIALSGRDIGALLIPSRGAFPIFLGAISALKYLGREHEDFKETYQRLNPVIPVNGWLDRDLPQKDREKDLSNLNILFAPFTADLNIPQVDNLEMIRLVRDYWSKVTSSFFLPVDERGRDPHFRSFTNVILEFIEGRKELADVYRNFPQIKKMGLIDTVISGRASSNILESLDSLEIEPHSILVVDSSMEKLRTPFKQNLLRRKYEGKAQLIPTRRIVSEDEGAALEGVIALVYPSLMIRSLDLEYQGKDFFFGAGSWHYPSITEAEYSKNFGLFLDVIKDTVAINTIGHFCERKTGEEPERDFENSRRSFLENMAQHNFLRKRDESVDVFNLNPALRANKPYETGSHVLHVPFDENSTNTVMAELMSVVPQVSYDSNQ